MGTPRRLLATVLAAGFTGLAAGVAGAQVIAAQNPAGSLPGPGRIVQVAAANTGVIAGVVRDARGRPLGGVVVSAMGGSTSFALSDGTGQFTLHSLMPGPYLVRAHLEGYLPARSAMVNVRPAGQTKSTFILQRESRPGEPAVVEASAGAAGIAAVPETERDESPLAWRLRHLKRSVLKDAAAAVEIADETQPWQLADSMAVIGRAVGSSARVAGAFLARSPLEGQINLLTTGAFDAPGELLQLERTRGVAYFSLGAPVGSRGDWTVKAALNQGDLSSWIVTGNYFTRPDALDEHRYQFGMSYGLHRYEGGNATALAAMPEGARSVGSVYGYDEWRLADRISVGLGAHYAHYGYLMAPDHLSPRLSASIEPTERTRIRAVAARHVAVPGAEEFIPPSRAQVLPPQRTFAPLTRTGFLPEDMRHYEVVVERIFDGVTLGVRGFQQNVGDQLVTVFGLRSADALAADFGHYAVGSAGDVDIRGWGVTLTHALAANVRGSFEYSLADAQWGDQRTTDRGRLARSVPSALRDGTERIHDFTTSVETELAPSGTRVYVLYKMNSAYIRADGSESRPGLDGRWDLQVSQGLPFMNFTSAEWEMLVAVRNLFRESFTETSLYDELLVARPPKRLVGGITVKF